MRARSDAPWPRCDALPRRLSGAGDGGEVAGGHVGHEAGDFTQRLQGAAVNEVDAAQGGRQQQKAEREDGRWYPEFFRINFSRCIFCGLCEEACPTTAIQLTPDFEMGEYRRQDLVYEKEDLLISGPGKYPDYNFYRMSGMAIDGKPKGDAENEAKPIDVKSLLP